MSTFTLPSVAMPSEVWPDSRLVRECLNGREEAWFALIEKYKRLIYSIPIKYGLTTEDATDIFNSVCLEALSQLEELDEPQALPKRLMRLAAQKSYRHKLSQSRSFSLEDNGADGSQACYLPPEAEEVLREAQQEQSLRDAVAALPLRCARLVQALFFVQPAVPYAEVVKLLGMENGAISFIRGSCLTKLRKELQHISCAD